MKNPFRAIRQDLCHKNRSYRALPSVACYLFSLQAIQTLSQAIELRWQGKKYL